MNIHITPCWPTISDFCAIKNGLHSNSHVHSKKRSNSTISIENEFLIYRVSYGQMGQRYRIHLAHHNIHYTDVNSVLDRLHLFSMKIHQMPATRNEYIAMSRHRKKSPNWSFTLYESKYTDKLTFSALEDLLALYLHMNTLPGTVCLSSTRFRTTHTSTSVERIFYYDSIVNKSSTNSHRITEQQWNQEILNSWKPLMDGSVLFVFDPWLPGLDNFFQLSLISAAT